VIHRHISLYWGSISFGATVHVLLDWLVSAWRKPDIRRAELIKQIGMSYGEGVWYAFGSARSGLSCFLKTFLSQGDEVIISAYTCLAVPTGLVAAGLIPVYVDIDSNTLAIDEARLWAAVTPKTKAIVVQHTLGNPAPILQIRRKAHDLGLLVIEDCALSLGTKINGQYVGTFGDAAIFSMELSKTLSCGWGGLLLVNNAELVVAMNESYLSVPEQSIAKSTRDLVQTLVSTWCSHPLFVVFPGKYIMWLCWKVGLFRPSTPTGEFRGVVATDFLRKMGAAQTLLATLQWRKFEQVAAACADNHALFTSELRKLGYIVHVPQDETIRAVANRVSFLVKERVRMLDYFRGKYIELGVWFDGPLSPVPTEEIFNYKVGAFPVAESIANQVVNIPCHNRLSHRDKQKIITSLREYTKQYLNSNNT
jgi:dTDP-4-amino-4,6-dideoxygalactose transaminase